MSTLGEEPVTIERKAGVYVDSEFSVTSIQTFPAILGLQPAPARVTVAGPEGARFSETWSAWAEPDEPELFTSEVPGFFADVVIRENGRRYQVTEYQDWTVHAEGLPHRVYKLVREAPDEFASA